MARAKQPPRGPTKDEASPQVENEAVAATETEAAIPAADATPAETGDEVAAELEDLVEAEVQVGMGDLVVPEGAELVESLAEVADETRPAAEFFPASVAPATESYTASFQTIVGEVNDYSKRSVESGSVFVRKLLGAKSLESAILIQSDYATTSYVDFVAHVTKITTLYSKLAAEILERRSRVA